MGKWSRDPTHPSQPSTHKNPKTKKPQNNACTIPLPSPLSLPTLLQKSWLGQCETPLPFTVGSPEDASELAEPRDSHPKQTREKGRVGGGAVMGVRTGFADLC